MYASIFADVIGSRTRDDPQTLVPTLGEAARRLNLEFAPALASPFVVDYVDELRGALADPAQVPLCVSVMREQVAPLMIRVGVAIDAVAEEAFTAALNDDRLVVYRGTGVAGDLLLNAFSALLDPALRRRTPEQWEAVRAMRDSGDRKRAAEALGITPAALDRRLATASWTSIADADAAIAAFLSETLGTRE